MSKSKVQRSEDAQRPVDLLDTTAAAKTAAVNDEPPAKRRELAKNRGAPLQVFITPGVIKALDEFIRFQNTNYPRATSKSRLVETLLRRHLQGVTVARTDNVMAGIAGYYQAISDIEGTRRTERAEARLGPGHRQTKALMTDTINNMTRTVNAAYGQAYGAHTGIDEKGQQLLADMKSYFHLLLDQEKLPLDEDGL